MNSGKPMDVLVIYRDELSNLPPLLSAILSLADAGLSLKVIVGSASGVAATLLEEHHIPWTTWSGHTGPGRRTPGGSVAQRGWDVLAFQYRIWRAIDSLLVPPVMWIGSGDTALFMGPRLLGAKYVLHLHELYDQFPVRRRILGPIARRALKIIVPEECRAAIARVWFKLPQTPTVVPNRPHVALFNAATKEGSEKQHCGSVQTSKTILYQGHIDQKERDLRAVARAVARLDVEWKLDLIGRDYGSLESLKEICPRVRYHGFFEAPSHLTVTATGYIGIVAYNYTSLNNIFCAPNKVWEYSYFGLPLLCNDVPALRRVIDVFGCGICVDFDDEYALEEAIRRIDSDYQRYSNNSYVFFNSGEASEVYASLSAQLYNADGRS